MAAALARERAQEWISIKVDMRVAHAGWRGAVALTPCTASSRRRRADWLLQLWNGIAIAGIPCSVGLCARF